MFKILHRCLSTKMARDLSLMEESDIEKFVKSFDHVLFDCDGVLLLGGKTIPGTQPVPQLLHSMGKSINYVSNNCTRTLDEWPRLFRSLDLYYEDNAFINAAVALIAYLKDQKFTKKIFVIGTQALRVDLSRAGFDLADKCTTVVEESISGLSSALVDDLEIGAVVVDVDITLTYVSLMLASIYLHRPEVLFINLSTDSVVPLGSNLKVIGPRHFQNALEDVTGRKPIVCGKPGDQLQHYLRDILHLNPQRTLFVGDSLIQDMAFASSCGFQKLLVFSGATTVEDLKKVTDVDKQPHYYARSLVDLLSCINKLNLNV